MENNNDMNNNQNADNINTTIERVESVTREINLDDLYDGAINNTVVIDPVTKDEVFLETKKRSGKALGVFFAVLILLVLYFVNNKMDFSKNEGNVAPVLTTTGANLEHKSGIVTCNYTSSSSSDNQKATYVLKYENDKIINSSFNYDVILTTEIVPDSILELMDEYEKSYLDNTTLSGSEVSFEKDDKGFMYSVRIDYNSINFEEFSYIENKTKLYAKPSIHDTVEVVKEIYTNKGYNCIVSNNIDE